MGERRVAYRNLVRKRKKEGSLGRPRRMKKVYIRMDLQETGWGTWIGLWHFGTVIMNILVPKTWRIS
jgi:hypothetical protein